MTMPSSVLSSVNGQGFKRQEEPFDESSDISVHQNGTNGKEPEQSILEPKERLLGLTKQQQRIVKAVRRLPGSEAVGIGNAVNLSRHAALGYLNKLADEKGVLDSDKYHESRGGFRKSIHFWLADDIPAELVDAILGDSDADPEAILAAHKSRTKEKSTIKPTKDADLSPMAIFASLPPFVKEVAVGIGQAGDKGISVMALSQFTGQKVNRIYDRVRLIVDPGLATKQPVPGFKNQFVYVPTSALKEIVGQLASQQANNADPVPNSTDAFDPTMANHSTSTTSPESTEDVVLELVQENQDLWQVMKEIAEELKGLKQQFDEIQTSIRGKRTVKADDIRAILRSKTDK